MPNVAVYDINGTEVETFELSDSVFGKSIKESKLSEAEIQQRRQRLFYEAVRYQMAKRRTGNHAVKSRSLVSGGGRKPFRQKGTGRARAGTTRAPHWRGGGVVHGPQVRTHNLQMNKKTRRAALCAALAHRSDGESIRLLNSYKLEKIGTKQVANLLSSLQVDSVLFVVDGDASNFQKSTRNIPNTKVISVDGLNVYDILKYKVLFCTPQVIKSLVSRLG
jgi:large subunit ribosomal protein L4